MRRLGCLTIGWTLAALWAGSGCGGGKSDPKAEAPPVVDPNYVVVASMEKKYLPARAAAK